MDIIEIAIEILKQKYSPPIVAGNEQKIKDDMIAYFLLIIEEFMILLNCGLPYDKTIAMMRGIIKRAGLKDAKIPPRYSVDE